MTVCTELYDWILDAVRRSRLGETGLQLDTGTGSFPSTQFHSIGKLPHMAYFLVWGCGKQAGKTTLGCPRWAIRASLWCGKSTAGGSHMCRSTLFAAGRASGDCSRYRDFVESHLILSEHVPLRFQQPLSCCWNCGEFYTDCDPAGGMECQAQYNLCVHYLDTRTKNRPAPRDDLGCNFLGNLPAMLLKWVGNAQCCHLHRKCSNTRFRCWGFLWWWEAGVPARVPHSASLTLFILSHLAASEE